MANRYQLAKSDPNRASQLGMPVSNDFNYVVKHSSQDWNSKGDLVQLPTLQRLIDTEVVGASNAVGAAACNGLLTAIEVADDALHRVVNNAPAHYPGTFLDTYVFFVTGTTDPVRHQYWNTESYTVGNWTFERILGPKMTGGSGTPKTPRLPKPPTPGPPRPSPL